MNLEDSFACDNCVVTKKTYNDELLQLRTSFVEYKKKAICTDKLFKQLTAKRSQVTKIEGKLQETNNTLTQAQEQLKSALINYTLITEKCKGLELELANVKAERDKELCDVLIVQQQKAAVEEKLKSTNQRLENVQAALAENKKDAKNNAGDKKALEKLTEKFVAQGVEASLLRNEFENQEANCLKYKKELEEYKSRNSNLNDKLNKQENKFLSLQEEFHKKVDTIKTLKETLSKANEANEQVENLVEKLHGQETECLLLRDMVTSQREEMELLRQTAVNSIGDEKLRKELTARENEIILLRQELSKQDKSNNGVEGDTTLAGVGKLQEKSPDPDCQRTMLNTELQNLREQLETMKFEFDKNDTEQLKTQLSEKESEVLLLKNELEMQKRALEEARQELEANEKDISQRNEQFTETCESTAINGEEIFRTEEMAALKSQLSTLQSEENLKDEKTAETKEGAESLRSSENSTEEKVTSNSCRQSNNEITALKLQMSALQSEVDLKSKEIEELRVSNELLSKSNLCSENRDLPVSTLKNSAAHDEIKLQLANFHEEVVLKAKEIERLRENEMKNKRCYELLKEKGRLAEERAFELVAELARLKAQDKGTDLLTQKCVHLEKILSLRESQITQLRIELKGLLSCGRREPRKPSGACSSSSGRGSCETSDLEDSVMLVDLDLDPDVGEIVRQMVAVPALLAPIDAVEQPVPPVLNANPSHPPMPPATGRPYNQSTVRSTQEKMLLALVESVRSATESYEKLYGTTITTSVLPQPPPIDCTVRAKPVGYAVVDEWIKNVSPDIGADQRSFCNEFGSASSSKGSVQEVCVMQDPIALDARTQSNNRSREMSSAFCGKRTLGGARNALVPIKNVSPDVGADQRSFFNEFGSASSSKGSVQEVCIVQDPIAPDASIQSNNRSRELSSAFCGKRTLGGGGNALVPSQVVALSRQLKSVSVKKSPYEADLKRVRNSVALANKADLFVVNKAPTMATFCANLNVEVPPMLADTADEDKSICSSANMRTTRSQVLNRTMNPSAGSAVITRKKSGRKKIPPISESFIRSTLTSECNTPTELNYVKNSMCITKITATAIKTVDSPRAKSAAVGKPEATVTSTKKKRKAKIDILFGSDDELTTPTKKQCADDSSTVYSDDEISIVLGSSSTPSTSPSLLCKDKLTLRDGTETQSSQVGAEEKMNTHMEISLVPKTVTKSDTNTNSLGVSNVVVHEACEESVPETASSIHTFPTPESGNDCEETVPKTLGDNNPTIKVTPPDPGVEGEAIGSAKLNPTAKNNPCEINLDNPQTEAKIKGFKIEIKSNGDENEPGRLSEESTSTVDLHEETVNVSDCNTAAGSVDLVEIKSMPVEHMEDDELSECELIIADAVDEPLEVPSDHDSPDDYDKLSQPSVSVRTEPTVKDESLECDSDDEPLSSLVKIPPKASLPLLSENSPSKHTVATTEVHPNSSELPICDLSSPPKVEINRPFFYKTLEEAKDCPPSPEIVIPRSPSPPPKPEPPPPPPLKITRDETGVWNSRIYVKLAHNELFNFQGQTLRPPYFNDVTSRYLKLIFQKYFTSTSEDALPMTVASVSDVSEICIVKRLMEEVLMDKGVIEISTTDDLRTSSKIRKIIALVFKLLETKPKITEELLLAIEKRLCNLSEKPKLITALRYISLYLGICLRLHLSERTRTFLYDVLYCFKGEIMYPVCSHILVTAPFSLKHGFMGQDDIISQTIAYLLQYGKNEFANNDQALKKLVAESYKYGDLKLVPLVERIVSLLKGGYVDFVEACIVLLTKRLGWLCSGIKVVPFILTVVDLWQSGSVPLHSAVVALRSLAYFGRSMPKTECLAADALFNRFVALLKCGKPEIYEPTLEGLMIMSKEKHYSTVISLLKNHEATSSEKFIASATSYIASVTMGLQKRVRNPPKRFTVNHNVKHIKNTNSNDEGEHSDHNSAKEVGSKKVKLNNRVKRNMEKREKWVANVLKK